MKCFYDSDDIEQLKFCVFGERPAIPPQLIGSDGAGYRRPADLLTTAREC